jgi:hypothetical protein
VSHFEGGVHKDKKEETANYNSKSVFFPDFQLTVLKMTATGQFMPNLNV